MKILTKSLRWSITLTIFITFNINTFAQQWVESMQDPNANFFETQRLFNEYFKDKEYEKGKGWKQFKRWEYFMKSRVDANGHFTHSTDAYTIYKQIQQEYSTARLSQGTAGRWTSLGPNGPAQGGGSGRLNCMAFHPTNSSYILAGAASGGIWLSTNNGGTWKTYTDDLGTLGISSIAFALSDPNVVYAATGDKDASDTYTMGVIKSTDGGKHWTITGLSYPVANKRLVYKVLVHPTNKNLVYATTSSGIYKTTDGGTNWTKIRYGAYKDMEFKPGNPNTIYFAASSNIIRTTNGGSTFSTLSFSPAMSVKRLEMAVTEADSNYLYVIAAKSSDNGFGGLYLSTDGGNTFTTKSTTPNILGWKNNGSDQGGQGWYDLAIAVSPTNKNMVFTGGINIWRSTNAGANWTINAHWTGNGAPYVHSDIHGLEFTPHSSTTIWACSDGGAYNSSNNGSSWFAKNNGLSIGQMYRMGASATASNKIMSGWQDNGSSLFTNSWQKVLGGDGMECLIDYTNNNIMYGSLYYGNIRRSANGGVSWITISNSISEDGAWVTPYVIHPTNPNILYAGYKNVYKTVNRGNSWSKISNFNTTAKIEALAVAPSNTQVIYIATSYAVKKTTDGGNNWTDISNGINGSVTYFAIHPTNPNIVWATLGGFFNGTKVMKSINGGQTWTNISGNLPNLPVNCIVYEKNTADGIYIGTDVGVYYRDNNLNKWVPFMKGLPNVIVKELEIFYPTNKIRAATYGRSMWESDLYALANSIDEQSSNKQHSLKIYPNPTQGIINIDMSNIDYKKAQIRIVNSIGELVFEQENEFRTILNISVRNLQSGIYFIDIQTEGNIFNGKFIKQ
jgi:photosystem II stability/assembly factor-like uncharacterized protein